MIRRREFLQAAGASALAMSGRLAAAGTGITAAASNYAWLRAADIARNVRAPTFPDRDFLITKYGAQPDGTTLCTKAIADAIAACHQSGGGRVVVPAGRFLTGAIHLLSNVNL